MCIPAIGNCKSTQQFTSLLVSVAAATLCRSTPIGSIDSSVAHAFALRSPRRLYLASSQFASILWLLTRLRET